MSKRLGGIIGCKYKTFIAHGGGGLELVKLAREPASSRLNPCASLKKPHESCPFVAPCGLRWKKINRGQRSAFSPLRNLLVRAFDSRAQGFSPPLARQRSSCPPPSPNLVPTHPTEHYYQTLRDSAPCLSRAATLPKGTKLDLGRGAHTPGNTILSQPYRRRVSTDRPNRCISRG